MQGKHNTDADALSRYVFGFIQLQWGINQLTICRYGYLLKVERECGAMINRHSTSYAYVSQIHVHEKNIYIKMYM